ncbi:MAG: T9SS type A sorting domain-containing protein [Ignavibacteria bacterium]|nr:T9SS type A sorting domain-containing protein [Ignavibacteria bacterium]
MKIRITHFFVYFMIPFYLFSQGLKDVTSGGNDKVIAVGKNGLILRSTNGGEFFSSSIEGNSDLNSVFAISDFACTVGKSGKIFISSNSGMGWQSVNQSSSSDFQSVYFVDAVTGFICGTNGTILKSTSGGTSWFALSSGITSDLNDIKFRDPNTGFVCGSGGTVLKTTNGGANWNNLNTGINKELLSVDIKVNTVFVTGKRSAVYRSTNEGSNWSFVDYRLMGISDVNSLFMIDENAHYAVGGGGFIRKSTDGGTTYTYQSNPMLAKLNSIFFTDLNNGWAVSENNNVVLRTVNGGANWLLYPGTTISYTWTKVLQLPANQYLSGKTISVNHQNPHILFAAGGNIMYRSSDGGSTWSQAFTMPNFNLCGGFLNSPYDSNKFVVILRNISSGIATVHKTNNYGANWQLVYSGDLLNGGMPIEADPVHHDTIYFGASGTLYRSTNFGSDFSAITSLPIFRFCDIAVSHFDRNIIFISSNFPSRLFRSTNWGLNFTKVDSSIITNSELPSIVTSPYSPLNIYHVFIGNTTDALRKSLDGGSTWSNGYITPLMWGMDIANDDPNLLYTFNYDTNGTDRGYVNISFDNGNTYTQTPIRENLIGKIDESIFNLDRANVFDLFGTEIYKLVPVYSAAIGIQQISSELPKKFSFSQNYPNPFNPKTNIEFSLAAKSQVNIKIYDLSGKEIERLFTGNLTPGKYKVSLDATAYSSGIYFCIISTEHITGTVKMVLIK